jgi:hypothetical protein
MSLKELKRFKTLNMLGMFARQDGKYTFMGGARTQKDVILCV